MESHPLNLAHAQHRRADSHLINHRYEEAMQCHQNAAELLLDAMKTTSSSVALESITLQHSYHLKQKDLIKNKRDQYERVKKAMENIKCLSKDPLAQLQLNDYPKVQIAIYKAISETDSLLNELTIKRDDPTSIVQVDVVDGKKIEKTQQMMIEELQILSQNLHSLVEQLVLHVEVLKDENESLKERVNYLEKERIKYLTLPTASNDFIQRHNFTNISMATEGLIKDSVQRAPRESNVLGAEKPSQNFDLSALKCED